jgi:hypothetical protein
MRHRLPSPVPPFDLIPPTVVEAAKRLFDLVKSNTSLCLHGVEVPDWLSRSAVS